MHEVQNDSYSLSLIIKSLKAFNLFAESFDIDSVIYSNFKTIFFNIFSF